MGNHHLVPADGAKLARKVTRTAQYLKGCYTSATPDLSSNAGVLYEGSQTSAVNMKVRAYSSTQKKGRVEGDRFSCMDAWTKMWCGCRVEEWPLSRWLSGRDAKEYVCNQASHEQ